MLAAEHIKSRIKELYRSSPEIHINVSRINPKVQLDNFPVKITGVYPHIFVIEEYSKGTARRHSVQYNELLTNNFEIIEL